MRVKDQCGALWLPGRRARRQDALALRIFAGKWGLDGLLPECYDDGM
ncbi:hypothetical protein [Roseiflexus sp.]